MTTVAVVPIFMSAGAAVLPTVVAAATSVAAIAFKPRESLRICRERPAAAASIGATVVVALTAIWWLASGTTARAARRAEAQPAARYDWAKVAAALIAREAAGPTVAAAPTAAPQPAPAPIGAATQAAEIETNSALVLGRDYARCAYGGGPSPRQLKPLWSFKPEDTMFLSSPAVAGGRIYVAGCQSDLGAYTGVLACLDAETGKPLWQITQAGDQPLKPFFSSPALTADGKSLLIGQGLHEDHDCALLCFDAATGQLRWSVKTSLHIESSPAILGDLVVIGAGAIEGSDGKPTGDPGHVIAARISDGRELWRQPVNDPESAPALDDDGTAYIGSAFNGSAVVAIRSAADEELREKELDRVAWRAPVACPMTGAITLAGDLAIAGGGNSDVVHSAADAHGLVIALDRKTGQLRWKTDFGDAVLGEIACRDGTLLCPVRTGEVVALALNDGHVLWRSRVSGSAPVLAGCAFTGKRVYAVSSDGFLAVLDAKDGRVLVKTYLNDQAKPGTGLSVSSPQVVGGRVIVGSETGGVQCLVGPGDAE